MQVSYSSLFVCFDLYPRHIAPALMLQRTPPQADQDRKDEPVFFSRRSPTSRGWGSLFSGLVYCPDCGAKLHFSAAKSMM